jgi:enolase-phosphatase E1
MPVSLSAAKTNAILLDIEGTTTPISFVYDVLFPFARTNLPEYVTSRIESGELDADVTMLRAEHATDANQHPGLPQWLSNTQSTSLEGLTNYVTWLMDRDRKSTGLKSLQGKIWEQGYRSGSLRSQVFADVPPALKRWREARLKIAIFSSGSVLAQKLLFEHTDAGDLTEFLDAYFDTTVGPKTSPDSYQSIVAALQVTNSATLFISDVLKELDAAHDAGLQTLFCVRAGNNPQPMPHNHPIIRSFDEIL